VLIKFEGRIVLDEEVRKRIFEDMDKSGYTLEVDVLNWLMQKSWAVHPQYTYIDKITQKLRSVDVVAHPYYKYHSNDPRLIIECKSTTKKEWIFFTPPALVIKENNSFMNEAFLFSHVKMQFALAKYHPECKTNLNQDSVLKASVDIRKSLHYFKPTFPLAFSCHLTNSGTDENYVGDFRRAVYQLNDAYSSAEFTKSSATFLCIVFRGPMFALDQKKHLSEIEHVGFVNLSEDVDNFEKPPVFIDVVKDTYFSSYIDIISEEMKIFLKSK
jgi:hypothetical protein